MNFRAGFLATIAAAAVFGASAASASTVLESFNNFPNGPSPSYTSQGFTYTPTKTTNGQCFESLCLQEADQSDGVITTITYSGGAFDFLGFYLNFNGLTQDLENNFLTISDGTNSLFLNLGQTFAEIGLATVYGFVGNGNNKTLTALDTSTTKFSFGSDGFLIGLGDFFTDVTSINFTSDGQGTIRIDCAYYNVGETGSFSEKEFTNCSPSTPPVVPLPAAGWLLLAGLGGLAALRKRKAA